LRSRLAKCFTVKTSSMHWEGSVNQNRPEWGHYFRIPQQSLPP
jgi:hypothetical protein